MEESRSYRRRTAESRDNQEFRNSERIVSQTRTSKSLVFQKISGMKPENIFLYIAIIMGLIFAIFQPLFIEPDSSFHFERATYISNTVVDRSKIGFFGEDYGNMTLDRDALGYKGPVNISDWKTGTSWISSTTKDGTYFKLFFQTKLPIVSKDKVQDDRVKGSTWLNDISHAVPGLGVMVGHMIYPSIGSMVITARIFNLIFFILALYFIIKFLKVYKLLFVFISLSPTVIQLATSLSYDCYGYVVFALVAACLVNAAYRLKNDKRIGLPQVGLTALTLGFSGLALSFAKSNFLLLYILLAVVAIATLFKSLGAKISSRVLLYIGLSIVAIGLVGVIVVLNTKLLVFLPKLYFTLLEPYYTVLSTEVLSGTATVGIPNWLVPIQFAVLFLVLLSQREEVVPAWFAWTGLSLGVINLFGILFKYSTDKDFVGNVITGPQGRYFTPFILLLGPIFTILARKVGMITGQWLKRLIVIISVLSLSLNFAVSATRFYMLHKPLDEYRSGVQHYIFNGWDLTEISLGNYQSINGRWQISPTDNATLIVDGPSINETSDAILVNVLIYSDQKTNQDWALTPGKIKDGKVTLLASDKIHGITFDAHNHTIKILSTGKVYK